MTPRLPRLLTVVLALVLVLAACGDDPDDTAAGAATDVDLCQVLETSSRGFAAAADAQRSLEIFDPELAATIDADAAGAAAEAFVALADAVPDEVRSAALDLQIVAELAVRSAQAYAAGDPVPAPDDAYLAARNRISTSEPPHPQLATLVADTCGTSLRELLGR
ncbi:MAG TPA: hypothetical protein VK866_14040 [Acidimicrobiales bacterium]|nr:hypothetical protein [Acidimicrobiales bacterium]